MGQCREIEQRMSGDAERRVAFGGPPHRGIYRLGGPAEKRRSVERRGLQLDPATLEMIEERRRRRDRDDARHPFETCERPKREERGVARAEADYRQRGHWMFFFSEDAAVDLFGWPSHVAELCSACYISPSFARRATSRR